MDPQSPPAATHTQGDLQAEHGDCPSPRARRAGRRQTQRMQPPEPIELLLKTVRHFLSNMSVAMNRLPDPATCVPITEVSPSCPSVSVPIGEAR